MTQDAQDKSLFRRRVVVRELVPNMITLAALCLGLSS
ncbi:MAG: CDP-diacylglycerol--serine O-phosphatidyltransferase, partial [Alphaproteobacteria bacterium]|nr:CDP-diacylglycerol--serine O-phosphatidyltransferase [Alphaproteobacteria bacterium]